jgi:hypothetical protein
MLELMVLTERSYGQWFEGGTRYGSNTLSHCGTGNAGEGSKHLVATRAALVSTSIGPISALAIVVCLPWCEVCWYYYESFCR